jgi:glycerol transport system ATP-binding protein
MLALRNVTRTVDGAEHIRDVSMTLANGTLNVLLGPTLAGKTSLMRLMAGLDRPTTGQVLVDGQDVARVPVQKRNVAMVYQQFINYPTLTVYENIASPLRVSGVDRATIDREVRSAADLLKLGPMLQRMPLELSGGQQQRTAIARAIVKKAGLVLLDEPLANLDYKLREELRAELPKIFAESGAIYVYATTEPTEALLLGGNTATLHEGRVTQFGPTIDVFRRPQDLITARTFADPPLNTIGAVKRGGTFVLADGAEIAVPAKLAGIADGPCTIGFRAHHLGLVPQTQASVAMQAEVQVSEITGSESYIHVLSGGVRWVLLAPGIHNFDPGARIVVHLDTRHILVFDPDGRVVAPAEPMAA